MKTNTIIDAIETMSRKELVNVAKQLNVPIGKSRKDTVYNISGAIVKKKARFTLQFTIRKNDFPTDVGTPPIYIKKLRTHKPDKVIFSPKGLLGS